MTSNLKKLFQKIKYPRNSKCNNKYEYIRELGEGAFCTVHLAKSVQSNKYVAIKKSKIDSSTAHQLYEEAELIEQIKSQNVIKCYGEFTQNYCICLSLEYCDGGDMGEQIEKMQEKGRLFSERKIWFYFHQICNGLKDMHQKRIIHRDIKPSNILLNFKGQAKIGDLGFSRLIPEYTRNVYESVGTEYYIAPERSGDDGYGFESDIWSLGCLLYEFVTLRSPFNGEMKNVFSLHKKISEAKYIPISSDLYSDQLHFFITKCLSIDPNDRPSAEEAHMAARQMHVIFEQMNKKYKRQNSKQKKNF